MTNFNGLKAWLKEHKITEVECIVSDLTGIARGKIMPASKFCDDAGIRLPEGVLVATVTGDYLDDYSMIDPAEIDVYLKPDPNAAHLLPWASEPTAQIIHDCYDIHGELVDLAPRTILRKVLKLYSDLGLTPIVAPEAEFYLTQKSMNPDSPLQPPIGRTGRAETGRQSYSIDAVNEFDPLFEDVYDYCEAQNLDLETLIHEEGLGQMEINFRHGEALSLADQVFLFKRTLREAAFKHDLSATFMAKPLQNQAGSSMHIHQSVLDAQGNNIFVGADGGISDVLKHYIGGLQKYTKAATALFAPNVNSYRRFLKDESAPVNMHWGFDNRTVGLRVPEKTGPNIRVENRVGGADANPYLAMAATLACGYLGMQEKLEPSAPVEGSAYDKGTRELPRSLTEALIQLDRCEPLREIFGDRFVKAYLAVKEKENDNFMQVISSWEREYLLLSV
ncbi:MAG: glutamine synthetase [Oceanospirillaceae bacterium]|jgi:glutamine synthetase|tara:strand:+ start:1397 stop:2740 length:1344 start_codon:yes stop_codon:yes gene_type:complete